MAVVVGLTGGIGCGKSTVARMLAERGARVIDADAIVHELQAPGAPMLRRIAEAFGEQLIGEDGALDRAGLAAIVFRDPAARKRLNDIVHPEVGAEVVRRVRAALDAGDELLVVEIPLLFEGRRAGTGTAALMRFDATVLVAASEQTQLERQIQRDGATRDDALRRIRAQMPLSEKRGMADYVIENDGSLEQTRRQVDELIEALSAARP